MVGFSAVIGSWNTIATSRPRTRDRAASPAPTTSRSEPGSRTEPEATRSSGSSPISDSPVSDFPDPDSPISPTRSPRPMENDTSATRSVSLTRHTQVADVDDRVLRRLEWQGAHRRSSKRGSR